jgi:hypothetical protein
MRISASRAFVIMVALAVALTILCPLVYYTANRDAYSSATWDIAIRIAPLDAGGFELVVPYILHENIGFAKDLGNRYRSFQFSLVATELGTGLLVKGNGPASIRLQKEYVLERRNLDFFSDDPWQTNGLKRLSRPNITLCQVNETDYDHGNTICHVFLTNNSPARSVDLSMEYHGNWGFYEDPPFFGKTGGGGYRRGHFSSRLGPGWSNITGYSTPSRVHGDPAGPLSGMCLVSNAVAVVTVFTLLALAWLRRESRIRQKGGTGKERG